MIYLFIANILYIIGLHNAARFEYVHEDIKDSPIIENSKMILWRVRLFCLQHFGKFWSKGLITCPPCMALAHSSYIFWGFVYHVGFSSWTPLVYLLYVGALSGSVYVVGKIIDLVDAVTEKCYN